MTPGLTVAEESLMPEVEPLVSVVMPAYGNAEDLHSAVQSALSQSYQNLEVVIVDDGSPETLEPVIAAFDDSRLNYIRCEENHGAAAARNQAISAAKGELIAFLDSDDLWSTNKLARQIPLLYRSRNRIESLAGVFSGFAIDYVRDGQTVRSEERQPAAIGDYRRLVGGCDVSPGATLVIWRDVFDEIGPFEDSLVRFEDWDWLLRASRHFAFATVAEPLAIVRVGGRAGIAAVKTAGLQLKARHAGAIRQDSVFQWLKFCSSIEAEFAVAAHASGNYGSVIFHAARCLLLWPWRGVEFFLRAIRLILSPRHAKTTPGTTNQAGTNDRT